MRREWVAVLIALMVGLLLAETVSVCELASSACVAAAVATMLVATIAAAVMAIIGIQAIVTALWGLPEEPLPPAELAPPPAAPRRPIKPAVSLGAELKAVVVHPDDSRAFVLDNFYTLDQRKGRPVQPIGPPSPSGTMAPV